MKKKITAFLLVIITVLSAMQINPMKVNAASQMKLSDSGIGILKQMEGFAKYPYYDYSQYTVGYGTYCPQADLERYQRDGITEKEAEGLLRNYLVNMENGLNKFIDKYSLSLKQNQFDALALFTYNCGSSWMYNDTGIRTAVINGYKGNDFIYEMSRWCSAGGSVLSGLVKRRLAEANMYLNNIYSNTWPNNWRYVRFDGNGGTAGSKVQGFDLSSAASIKPIAVRDGYTFLGWYTQKNGGNKVTSLNSSVVNNTTLYAQWRDNSKPIEPEKPTTPPITNNQTTAIMTGVVYNCYSLRVRDGAGLNTNTVAYLNVGDIVEIYEQKDADGKTWGRTSKGWVSMNCIQITSTTQPDNGTVNKPEETPIEKPENKPSEKPVVTNKCGEVVNCWVLNVRKDAGESHKKISFLMVGTKVDITETKTVKGEEWGKCSVGWVNLKYIKFDTNEQSSNQDKQETQTGTIYNCTFLTVRKDAGKNKAAVGWYKNGSKVNIYETKTIDGVKWGRSDKGWISLDYVKLEAFQTFIGTVTANGLRVRQNPSLSASIIGSVNKGDKVTITETTTADGMQWGKTNNGWVSMNYINY